jgi:hypothetical protein
VGGLVGLGQVPFDVAVLAADPQRFAVVVHQACDLA